MLMIGRAIFWVGLVWLFIPHEPSVGLGSPGGERPDLRQSIVAQADAAAARLDHGCVEDRIACSRAAQFFAVIAHQARTRTLAQVKVEIEASIRARDLQQRSGARSVSG